MNAPSWLPVAGLTLPLLVAAVVALLYLLRPPPRAVLVPSILLWRRIAERRRSHALLRRLIAAMLSLAVALGLAFALAGPPRARRSGESQLVVVDDSATMATRRTAGPSRLAQAAARARELVAEWPGPTLLADTTGRSTPRWARSAGEAEAWLRGLESSTTPARLPRLDRIAADAGAPARRILVTDGVALAAPAGWQIESVYAPAVNVGLLAFGAGADALGDPTAGAEAFVEVFNGSPGPTRTRLLVERADGELLLDRPLELGAGETWSGILAFPLAGTGGEELVRARVETPDDSLAYDDVATIAVRGTRRLRIGTIGVDGPLERALALLPRVTTTALAADAVGELGSAEGSMPQLDLVVGVGWAPEAPPAIPSLLVAPPRRSWLPERVETLATSAWWASQPGGRDWGPVTVNDVGRLDATTLTPLHSAPEVLLHGIPYGGGPEAGAGEQELPLVLELHGLPAPTVVTTFPLGSSSVVRHEAFPVFVAEVVEKLTAQRGRDGAVSPTAGAPLGRRVSDVNASTLPVVPALAEQHVGETTRRTTAGAAGQVGRGLARILLLVALLVAALETWTRARGWTE